MTYLLAEEDINTAIHPNLWREICEALGRGPGHNDEDWPTMIEVRAVTRRYVEEGGAA